jgi:hypothetical protein
MMHQSKLALSTSVVMTVLLSSLAATASDTTFTATEVCNSALANPSTTPDFSAEWAQFGAATNYSTTQTRDIYCGVGETNNATDSNDDLIISYYDGKAGTSISDAIYCEAIELINDWDNPSDPADFVFAGSKYSCSTTGGCSSPSSSSFVGHKYLRINDIRHGGWWTTYVFCTIPQNPDSSGDLASFVKTLAILEQ